MTKNTETTDYTDYTDFSSRPFACLRGLNARKKPPRGLNARKKPPLKAYTYRWRK